MAIVSCDAIVPRFGQTVLFEHPSAAASTEPGSVVNLGTLQAAIAAYTAPSFGTVSTFVATITGISDTPITTTNYIYSFGGVTNRHMSGLTATVGVSGTSRFGWNGVGGPGSEQWTTIPIYGTSGPGTCSIVLVDNDAGESIYDCDIHINIAANTTITIPDFIWSWG